MSDNDQTAPFLSVNKYEPDEDVSCWKEGDDIIWLKVVTSYGDPVELNEDQADELAEVLLRFAGEV